MIIDASGLRSSIGGKLGTYLTGLACSFAIDDSKLKSAMDVTLIISKDALSSINL